MFKKALALLVVLALAAPAQATINFPSVLDNDTTLYNVTNGTVYIAQMHNNPKDAIVALETKVGVDNSTVTTSLDYILKNSGSVNPGHTHTGTSVSFSDGTAATPGLRFGSPVTDTNTGLFHPTSGAIAVSSTGVEVTRVTSTGLGIKTTSPFFPLDIAGAVRIQDGSSLCFGGTGASDNDTCVARSAAHVATLAGNYILTDQATTDVNLTLNGIAAKTGAFLNAFKLAADANPSFRLGSDGVTLSWGAGGASALDTTLTRSGANALTASGALAVGGNLTVTGTSGFTGNITASGTGTQTIGGSGATVTLGGTGASVVNINVGATGVTTIGNATGDITLPDSVDISTNTNVGTKIGTTTAQKIGFFNAAPVVQQTAATALITSLQNLGLIATGTFSGNITTTGTLNIGTAGATLTRYLTGSTTVDIGSITAPLCTDSAAFAVTNAADGDQCAVGGVAAAWVANATFACYVSSAGNVKIRECCVVGTCNPGSRTYKISLWQ